jgi:hypothetical protein
MNRTLDGPDPLLKAIAEFGEAMDQLIDEQIARLNALGAGAEETIRPAVGPASRPRRLAEIPENAESARPTLIDAASDLNAPRPVPVPAAPAATVRDADDPRQRLDALARHLDDRLRRERKARKSTE